LPEPSGSRIFSGLMSFITHTAAITVLITFIEKYLIENTEYRDKILNTHLRWILH
jgi:hypothetical protein